MEVFRKLLNNVIDIQSELPIVAVEIAVSNSEGFIDRNIEQLSKGLTKEGNPIIPELESDDYARGKIAKGGKAPLGTPDMIDEGDFTEGFYMDDKGDQYLIDSHDEKSPDLDSKYDGIFGLTKENKKEEFNDSVAPGLIKFIKYELTK